MRLLVSDQGKDCMSHPKEKDEEPLEKKENGAEKKESTEIRRRGKTLDVGSKGEKKKKGKKNQQQHERGWGEEFWGFFPQRRGGRGGPTPDFPQK